MIGRYPLIKSLYQVYFFYTILISGGSYEYHHLGSGKVGRTLAEQLSNEGHNIVMVDIIAKKVQDISEDADIMGVLGNASSINTLLDAGIETAIS